MTKTCNGPDTVIGAKSNGDLSTKGLPPWDLESSSGGTYYSKHHTQKM